MAFMVPVVKKDYDIYSRSPPKNKPILKRDSNSNISSNNSSSKLIARPQSNSITIAMIQNQKLQRQKSPQRVHSKSVNDHQLYRNNRNRSTSNSSASEASSESLEIVRKMMHFLTSSRNTDSNHNNNENSPKSSNKSQKDSSKVHWTAKIFKKRKNSVNSHKIS